MNLQGLNLRGLTVTFTFKNLEVYPSTENSIELLRVSATNISDYFIEVNASLIYDNTDGTGYYYYDDVRFNNNTLSVDSTDLDPVTYTFPDDMDYKVLVYDSEYVSCNLTEDDLYTTISGRWEITDITAMLMPSAVTETVNFTSNGVDFTGIYLCGRGYTLIDYIRSQDRVNVAYLDEQSFQQFDENFTVIDFGSTPQKVTKHFVRCLETIAEPLPTISGKWEIIYLSNLSSIPNDIYQEVNFTSHGSDYTHISISPSGYYIEGHKIVNGDYENITVLASRNENNIPTIWMPEIDFGSTPQVVSEEFLTYFKMLAIPVGAPITISGVWRIKDTLGDAPAANTIQNVNFTVNEQHKGVKLEFQGVSSDGSSAPYSHFVSYTTTDGMTFYLTSPADTIISTAIIDFGEEPQDVSEDFLLWMNHMAEPWAKVSGMWILNSGILDFSMIPSADTLEILNESVNFRYNDSLPSGKQFVINNSYSNAYDITYICIDDVRFYVYSFDGSSGLWSDNDARFLQFGETQYVSKVFKDFLDKNAVEAGDYAIEAGEHVFKLDPFIATKDYVDNWSYSLNISIPYTFTTKQSDGSDPDEQYTIYVGGSSGRYYIDFDLGAGWQYGASDSAEFRPFGWHTHGSTFQRRHINVLEKTYLTAKKYEFLSKVLIPLNSKTLLDTLGVWETAQSMKEITDLTIKYAKYMKYTPVADVLYYNTSGLQTVTGLDLSKYMYVTVKATASATYVYPTSTSFAVKNIEDCGGTMKLQIGDAYYWGVWNVTMNGFTPNSGGKDTSGTNTGYKIFEVIGYRWDAALETIEEPEPTYSYRYARGQLYCESGKNFNNYYNSDYNTEFRVELNFRLTSLGVELASNTASANNNWKLSVNENGNLVMNNTYDGTAATPAVWTEFTVQPNVWYSLSLYSNNLTSTNYTTTKGKVNVSIVPYAETPTHSYVTKSINKWSQFSTTRSLYIGGDNVELRNRVLVKGTKYHSGVTNTQSVLDVDVDNATIGGTVYLTSNGFALQGGLVYGSEE